VPVAAGLGVGVSALVWPMLLLALAPGRSVGSLVVIDAIVWTLAMAGAAFLFWRRPPPRRAVPSSPPASSVRWVSALIVAVLAAVDGAAFVARTIALPHGTNDAWAIWNLRARFLFRGYPTAWLEGFATAPDWSHPDYPPLLPFAVARGWSYIGAEHTLAPASLAALFWIATTLVVAGAVGRARGVVRGLLTAAVLLASPTALIHGSTQCADVPLAFFIVTAFVLMAAAVESDGPLLWVLSGASAGLAACTKNEGLAFCLVFFALSTGWAIRREGAAGWKRPVLLLAGAAAPLAAVVAFKIWLAPPNVLLAGADAAAKVGDLDRFALVGAVLARELWFGGAPWIGVLPIVGVFLTASGLRRGGNPVPALASLVAVGLVLVYGVVYVLTPYDLRWHLMSSTDRLVLHVAPLVVWSAMMLAK
jgi:hypothetical protein